MPPTVHILRNQLLAALVRINPHIPTGTLEQAAHTVQTISDTGHAFTGCCSRVWPSRSRLDTIMAEKANQKA